MKKLLILLALAYTTALHAQKTTPACGVVVAIEDTPDSNKVHKITLQYEAVGGVQITIIHVGPKNWTAFFEPRLIQEDDFISVEVTDARLTANSPIRHECSGHLWSVEEIVRPTRIYESPDHRLNRVRSWQQNGK